mmetsp:Transcript_17825/g.38893  ORF Transcript_17825/g.38893 Transcript_17825/m.38893 type:complete len:83 (-) Transcript_17825:303-551(-)
MTVSHLRYALPLPQVVSAVMAESFPATETPPQAVAPVVLARRGEDVGVQVGLREHLKRLQRQDRRYGLNRRLQIPQRSPSPH